MLIVADLWKILTNKYPFTFPIRKNILANSILFNTSAQKNKFISGFSTATANENSDTLLFF